MMRSRTLSSLLGRRRYHRLPAELEARLCTPALVIYGDIVRGNIAKVIEACGSRSMIAVLRPANADEGARCKARVVLPAPPF